VLVTHTADTPRPVTRSSANCWPSAGTNGWRSAPPTSHGGE
jgi:hypothetical protein